MNEKKYDGPRIMGPIAGPYLSEAELVRLGWMKAPATSFTMTDVTFAEIWDREKKRLRRGFRGRQKDLSPYFVQAECEEAARAGAKELQKLARAEKREAYDKARGNRPSGRRLNDRPQGGMVVAVDSEGMFVGEPFVLKAGRWKAAVSEDEALRRIANGESVYHRQRTCLWMAGGVEGFEDDILYDPQGLRSERIFEFLVSRPRKFASPDPRARQPVFVGFGLSYDIAQILADLPNDPGNMKLWEIRKGKPWEKRDDPTWRANYEGWHLWRSWAVAVLPGKKIKICKLRDPNRPFKYRLRKNGETERTVDWVERIVIYDVFGFYQRTLVEAIETMPGIISDEQMAIIKVGKMKRGELQQKDLNQAVFDESKLYTGTELIALTRMVEKTRKAIYDADPDRPIRLRHLYGAGAAAQGLLETRLSAEAREILGRIEFVDDGGLASGIPALVEADLADAVDETMEGVFEEIAGKSAPEGSPDHEPHEDTLQDKSPLIAATYAFVGGRIELVKQGKTTKRLYSNDISSAYPAEIAELPSMKGGRWVYCKNPTRKQIVESNRLSMFHVRTLFAVGEPFYPLPYRNGDGSIMFPSHAQGCYMRDDVLAAFEWRDVLGHHGLYSDGGLIDVEEALFFEPAEPDDRPFAWVRELFDYRAALVKIDPNDVRAIVIKLMLNSIYGKFAQGVGNPGSPPRFASPWMAAAITAGTRRKLLKAALTAPKAIVSFMTDGIVSEKPLQYPDLRRRA